MKVTMTVNEAIASQMALRQLGQNKFPIQTSLILSGNQRQLDEVGEEFNKRRNELVKQYGEPDTENGGHKVKKENIQVFTDEANEMAKEDVELEMKTVSIKDLGKDFEVEANVLAPLHWMITLEGQKPTRRKRNGR